jgi:uncharacterized phage-associated protein
VRAWYNVNPRKALEVIVWFANRQNPIDFYHILKVLFYADKQHLNMHGRPILGDTYDALPHWPVARTVYGLLKRDDALEAQFLAGSGLEDDDAFDVTRRYWVCPRRSPDLRCFSQSDLEALEWSFTEYGSKTFDELEELTHRETAWCNARENGGIIKYEDMLEGGRE